MKRLVFVAVLAVGCGGDPVDIEGTWTVGLTNRTNGCNFENWTEGESSSGVTAVITQNGEAAIVDITGGAGLILDIVLGGDDVFTGNVDGDELDALREGTRSMTTGNCTYTYNAQILATVNGDAMTGRINYRTATNGNSDCAALECVSYQDFNGTRPPR